MCKITYSLAQLFYLLSAKAIKAFQDNYPEVSTWPPAFIVSRTSNADVDIIHDDDFTYDLSVALSDWSNEHDVGIIFTD